jgi:hypothetical protein
MNTNGIEIQVCTEGRPVREFGHNGQLFVEGRKDVPFTLKIRNHRSERANVVVLVDGINVVEGNETKTRGYIIPALGVYEVQGWRTSLDGVATFVFKSKKGSYAKAKTGSDKMSGLITLIAFTEKQKPIPVTKTIIVDHHHHHDHWYPAPYYPRPRPFWHDTYIYSSTDASELMRSAGATGSGCATGAAGGNTMGHASASSIQSSVNPTTMDAAFSVGEMMTEEKSFSGHVKGARSFRSANGQFALSCNAASEAPELHLGTGWGDKKEDRVVEVEWENGVQVAAMELYYADAKALAKVGIDVKKAPAVAKSLPSMLGGFCQPPA